MKKAKGVIVYKSKLDPSYLVYIISKDYKNYKDFKKTIGKDNLAYTTNEKVILIDAEQLDGKTPDHVRAIEAHEIAHHVLKHEMIRGNKKNEIEADYYAFHLLANNEYDNSAALIKKYFQKRHDIQWDDAKSDRIWNKVKH